MSTAKKWNIVETEKNNYIYALTNELAALRAKVGISQEDLARIIGVSRQTYGSIEGKARKMSWSTYLSLILFFDYNQLTRQMIRDISAFPNNLINRFNDGEKILDLESEYLFGKRYTDILSSLDEQALHSLKTVLMVEYARCANLPGDYVVRSFNGVTFSNEKTDTRQLSAIRSIKRIKERRKNNEE